MIVCLDCLDWFSVDKKKCVSCRKYWAIREERRREPSVEKRGILSRKEEEQREKGEACALLGLRGGDRNVEKMSLEGGFVLQKFVEKRTVPVPDAHRIGANVLQHIYGPTQAPIHKVCIPGRVAFSGHVYLDERTLRPDGPASCIHRLCGPDLENWKAGVRGCFVWLHVLPCQAPCGGGLRATGARGGSHGLGFRG